MAREYFLAYHSYLEILMELSDAECGRLFRAALEYSATKKTPDLRGNERFLFATLKVCTEFSDINNGLQTSSYTSTPKFRV